MPSQRSNVDPRLGPFKPGDRFEKYEIRRLLGRGAHAFVYEAQHTLQGRLVAIKVIPHSGSHGQNLQRLVQSEARVLTKLDHPKLVRVLDAGATDGDLVYVVMELLEGRTLREVYREHGKLTPAEVLAIGAQIAQGIEAAHAEKTIHRDLKPENVFVQAGNQVKVLDFGIAKFLDQIGHSTQGDIPQETLLYMAPEHLRALGVTPRSDIFALGTILYEGLAGKPPALISAARLGVEPLGAGQLCELQISEPAPDLEELIPGLPRHVARVVHKMIAKQPADRHGSMREVAEALVHGARRLVEGTGRQPAVLTSADPTPPPSAASGRFEAHRPERSRILALAVASCVAGLAIAITISRLSRRYDSLAPGPSALNVTSAKSAAVTPPPSVAPMPAPASASASAPASASASAAPPKPAADFRDGDPRKPRIE